MDWKRATVTAPPKDRPFLIATDIPSSPGEWFYAVCVWVDDTWPSGRAGYVSGFDNIGHSVIENSIDWWSEIEPPGSA